MKSLKIKEHSNQNCMGLDYFNKTFCTKKETSLQQKLLINISEVEEYTGQKIYDLEIMQWPSAYTIYFKQNKKLFSEEECSNLDGILTLQIGGEAYTVYAKPQNLLAKTIDRLDLVINLKRYAEEDYILYFNGPAQKDVGYLLDGLIYVCNQTKKVVTINPISQEEIIKQREQFFKQKKPL